MNFAKNNQIEANEKKPHRSQFLHRRNRFIREPFDIDDILGFNKENTFEQFEEKFAQSSRDKRKLSVENTKKAKKRRVENRKVWISELKVCGLVN
ncbi:unnamed protein product [Dracunculus medinensis]|uniref:Uncharacterized protein n=1 Tax=Dracunculus medinensis TaxID=318479 RepID=A0A0N4U5Q4_DRAME|nr:unnamed protein product [Dracunculus medinensis]